MQTSAGQFFSRNLTRFFLGLHGLSLHVLDRNHLAVPARPTIYFSRFSSLLDPLLLHLFLPGHPSPLLGPEGPFPGPAGLLVQLLYRGSPRIRGTRLLQTRSFVRSHLKPGNSVFIVCPPTEIADRFAIVTLLARLSKADLVPVALEETADRLPRGKIVASHGNMRMLLGLPQPAPCANDRYFRRQQLWESVRIIHERLLETESELSAIPHGDNPFQKIEKTIEASTTVQAVIEHCLPDAPPLTTLEISQSAPLTSTTPSPIRILVTGAYGQLGTELQKAASGDRFTVTAVDLSDLDITHALAVRTFLSPGRFDLVINAAAYTAVDKAEKEIAACYAVNRDGPALLAAACASAAIPMIHVSTDYVFDGKKNTPYVESDPVHPEGVYAISKAEGEEAVRSALPHHLIVRTSWLYSAHGQNFVKTALRLARERDLLRIVADQHGCPTSAHDLAHALLLMAERISTGQSVAWGTYHYCDAGETTWHRFTTRIVDFARRHESLKADSIEAITTDQYPLPAKRPAYSVLDTSAIRTQFGVETPFWVESLEKVIEELYKNEK
ncbi:MAG: dTDP-4-dehydrorhamnose reductase [Candidatus Ozemobacteraceae bacterium]